MKKFWYINMALLLAFSLSVGCGTTQKAKNSVTSKVTSIISGVDQNLFAQVPEDKREGVHKAEFDLKVSEEKMKLAELKKELAINQKEYADYEQDLTKKHRKDAAVALDMAKLEAIDKAGLGNEKDNIKAIADLEAKKLNVEADSVKIKAKLEIIELRISDLTKRIEEQKARIEGMKVD